GLRPRSSDETAMSVFLAPGRGLNDLVYPPRRVLRGEEPPGLERFCAASSAELFHDPHLCCPRCPARVRPLGITNAAGASCRAGAGPFVVPVRRGQYEGPLRDAVLRIKSNTQEGLAELLGEQLAQIHADRLRAMALDDIVPVPLHWWRRLRRGYNESAAIAR